MALSLGMVNALSSALADDAMNSADNRSHPRTQPSIVLKNGGSLHGLLGYLLSRSK
jgi:hypothetical protein